MKITSFFPILQVADSTVTGKDQVSESIGSLTMLLVFVSVLGAIFIIRMLFRQKRNKSEQG
jgi:hypothetical protein